MTTSCRKKILWYRDGVSESQFVQIEASETLQIHQAYTELDGAVNKLKIAFIVVGKRHHTRFFPKTEAESHGAHPNKPVNGNV
jgi:eukaryotic translation initiation factor 2C